MNNILNTLSIKNFLTLLISTLILATIITTVTNQYILNDIEDNVIMLEKKAMTLEYSSSEMKYLITDIQKIATTSILLSDENKLYQIPAKSQLFYLNLEKLLNTVNKSQFEHELNILKEDYKNFLVSVIALSASFTEGLKHSNEMLHKLNTDSEEFISRLENISTDAKNLSKSYIEEVKSQFSYLQKIHFVIFTSALLLLVSAALIINAKILNPISSITKTINKIEEDEDISIRFVSKSEDEISQVANSLNNMLSTIQNNTISIGKLQESVETKSKQIISQSRNAVMGEMIAMIAHQWRQPLGAIASTVIGIQIKSELNSYDLTKKEEALEYDAYINDELNNISEYVKNLTNTIDDFRNFYKPNKKTVNITLENLILKSLNIIKPSLTSNDIEIIEEYSDKKEINIYDSEMMQVIINILKNSQDNFIEKEIENPYIKITTNNKTISICDNGGGIDENIIDSIFDPYFTTKDEKNGTGLGLYMSKTIVNEHHNGNLLVKNTDDGVCFTIELT